ncbi:hypothetical protein L0337_17700 [candidate division KSB1 bacterium]|nr:hypothetical protein [candidate division KSB1 bacterium]
MVIPEDPDLDRYILKPVIKAVFNDLNRIARVEVLPNPRLRGVDQALDPAQLNSIINSYPQEDLFLLLIDRDCDQNRINRVNSRESEVMSRGKALIGCLAIEEVEMWALAIYQGELPARWQEMRQECDPKEAYFHPLVEQLGLQNNVGRGRKHIMKSLSGQYSRLLQLCPEIAELRDRIRQKLSKEA